MSQPQLWNIRDGRPLSLERGEIAVERDLESWIENEAGLVNPDLLIVGRQLKLDAGRLDLLALHQFGESWGVIEVKRGGVDARAVGQVQNYLLEIEQMSASELRTCVEAYFSARKLTLSAFLKQNQLDMSVFDETPRIVYGYVVGTGKAANLDKMTERLRSRNIEVDIVTFNVFQDANGQQTLMREITVLSDQSESKANPSAPKSASSSAEPATKPSARPAQVGAKSAPKKSRQRGEAPPVETILARAHAQGIGEAYELLYRAATKHGLFPRTFTQSIMYAPPTDKRRWLIYAPVDKKSGRHGFHVNAPAFAEFYQISALRAHAAFGIKSIMGYYPLTVEDVQAFCARLDRVFAVIQANSGEV